MTKSFLKDILMDEFRASKKKKTATDVQDLLHLEYGINLTYSQAYHGLKFTKEFLWGDDINSYSDLLWYKESIGRYNPGSVVKFEYDGETKQFQRFFVAFKSSMIGFNKYCRPMLFIDCTFLNGEFKGGLMVACGKTGNQEIYPVAFGIVPCENFESWEWFLTNLKGIISEDHPLTIISDHGAGLLKHVPLVFPKAYHSFCLYHMKGNIPVPKGKSRKIVVKLFEERYTALTKEKFYAAAKSMSNLKLDLVIDWMHDKRLPALELLDSIRAYVMEQNYKRKVESVDLDAKTCTCNWWQKHSFPCTHSMKAMLQIGPDEPYKYIIPYYTTEYYKGLYARPIYHIPDCEGPPKINEEGYVLPPNGSQESAGRPTTSRYRGSREKVHKKRKCGQCGRFAFHSRRKCRRSPLAPRAPVFRKESNSRMINFLRRMLF
ncbi:uncharacterized protein LOC113352574 [Papaver somniferum]|uniref:uncharacterized protein LOC113352574 n=1 Tax=Papaver somniferum TaxID=3469 RepID=UPI000E6FB322|nr:uncharacterized protein LOC113352574 [Papaver somniferum]